MKVSEIKSEINRLASSLREALNDPYMASLSSVRAIVTRIDKHLYNIADRCTHTVTRREMVENLDRIQLAAELFLENVDTAAQDEVVAESLEMLEGVTVYQTAVASRLAQLVTEELTRGRRMLAEEPEIQPGDVQQIANDSIDVALDGYFQKASETLDATGTANMEMDPTDPEKEQQFSATDFASDIATLVDRTDTLIDMKATIARRAYNHVAKKYGPDAAENFKQVLGANFDIELESERDLEGERFADRPAAAGAGGAPGGGGAPSAASGGSGTGAP